MFHLDVLTRIVSFLAAPHATLPARSLSLESIKAVMKLLALGVERSPEVDPCLHTRERLLTERLTVLALIRHRVHKRATRR